PALGPLLRPAPGGHGAGTRDRVAANRPVDQLAPTAQVAANTAEPARAGAHTLFAGKLWFWVPILPLVVLDLWSKHWVFAFLDANYQGITHYNRAHDIWGGPISFKLVQWYNTGTVWGIAQGFAMGLRLLRCVAVVVILLFVWRTSQKARLALLALGVILAGALGNLYDNFTVVVEDTPRFTGGVRDFLQLTFWGWQFPAFNVADSCITVGAICLGIWLLFLDPQAEKPDKQGG
ncbi:MAG: signal peptidase II, partial [Planctomycetota bacterium]